MSHRPRVGRGRTPPPPRRSGRLSWRAAPLGGATCLRLPAVQPANRWLEPYISKITLKTEKQLAPSNK